MMLSRRGFGMTLAASLALLLCDDPVRAAEQRALVLVWDSTSGTISHVHKEMASQVQGVLTEGQLASVRDLSPNVLMYDFSTPAQADALNKLGLTRQANCPYLAVVTLSGPGQAGKVLWGVHYFTTEDGLLGLGKFFNVELKAVEDAPAPPQINPILDPGPVPPRGQLPARPAGGRKIPNGPLWLADRDTSLRFGGEDLKLICDVQPRNKFPNFEDWVSPYRDQLSYTTMISAATGESYQHLPPDKAMLVGWVDTAGRSAWVVIWREGNGWRHVSNNKKSGVFTDSEDPFVLTWPIENGNSVRLTLTIPRYPGWSKTDLIYDLRVHAGGS